MVLGRRVDCRDVGADKEGDDDENDNEMGAAVSAPTPTPIPIPNDVVATDLRPRDEAPRLLVWAAGAARLIS